MLHSRKKAAEEMKTLALMAATFGNQQQAMDYYLKMTEFNRADKELESEKFTEDSVAKFEKFMSKFNK